DLDLLRQFRAVRDLLGRRAAVSWHDPAPHVLRRRDGSPHLLERAADQPDEAVCLAVRGDREEEGGRKLMDWLQWPGMRGLGRAEAWRFRCERGIWGKVHGAESDYRWIAASPGFASGRGQLYAELSVGQPTAPEKFTLWRAYNGRFYAVSCY